MRLPGGGPGGAARPTRDSCSASSPAGAGPSAWPASSGPPGPKILVFTGRSLGAEEAAEIGLADRLVEPERLELETLEFASRLAGGPVVAQGLAKRAIDDGIELPLAEGLALERELFARSFATRDAEIGVRSFLEHGPGKAKFVGA